MEDFLSLAYKGVLSGGPQRQMASGAARGYLKGINCVRRWGGWREGGTVLSQNPCLCDANVPHQPSTRRPICVQRVMERVLLITTLLGQPGV